MQVLFQQSLWTLQIIIVKQSEEKRLIGTAVDSTTVTSYRRVLTTLCCEVLCAYELGYIQINLFVSNVQVVSPNCSICKERT